MGHPPYRLVMLPRYTPFAKRHVLCIDKRFFSHYSLILSGFKAVE
jgi:hypothetical protein